MTVFPLGITLLGLRRPVSLGLPSTALVEGGGAPSDLATVGSLAGRSVVVLTEPEKSSLDTEAAKDLAFSVARVVLR